MYQNSQGLLDAIQNSLKAGEHVNFHGSYTVAYDELVSDRKRVEMVVHELWKVTDYRFTYIYYKFPHIT